MKSTLPVILTCLLVAGCIDDGRDLTFAEAKDFLTRHEPDLLDMIAQAERCQPAYKHTGIYNAIRLRDPDGDPVCADGDVRPVTAIKQKMRALNIPIADFQFSADGAVTVASFTVYAAGLAVSGVGVELQYWTITPPPAPSGEPGYERRELDEEPHHWYWERWAT